MTRVDRLPRYVGRMAVLSAIMCAVCVGGGLLCCFLPRIVEWR
jgi:hypothetical protein